MLTPFLVLVVVKPLYFPFITGKNFVFRILIEILAAIWIAGLVKFPSLRPKLSPLVWAVSIFAGIMGLATVFALSPYHSFWSNFERMEGYLGILHIFLYFLMLVSVFKKERDWEVFLYTTLGASVIVSFYSLLQLAGKLDIHQGGTRVDATLGNATYLAAYLLFHMFFLIWFFLRAKKLAGRIVFASVFILEAFILYHTATRGAILGMLGGLFVLATVLAWLAKGAWRRWSLVGLGVVVLIPVVFFLARDSSLVKSSPVLERFAGLSFQETTTRARFTIWGMALRGVAERPIIGWGQESFVYIFSKFYEPSLWSQEPWFDRAHNIFLDWMTAGGLLGLLSYLSIFGASFWILTSAYRKNSISAATFSVLVALLAAHFFQNFFVFDNLTSYLLFFAVVAYIHFVSPEPEPSVAAAALPANSNQNQKGKVFRATAAMPRFLQIGAAFGAIAFFAFTIYSWNIKPIFAAKAILGTLRLQQEHEPSGKVDAMIDSFKKGLALNTFATAEIREQISQAATFVLRDQSIAAQDRTKYMDFAISELETQKKENPYDMRAKAFLATLYTNAGRYQDAINAVNEALEVSSRRPQFYFVAAEAYSNAGQSALAVDAIKRAYDLAPDYPEAVSNMATILVLSRKDDEAEQFMLEHYGAKIVASERFAQLYAQIGRFDKALYIWKKIVESSPESAQSRANLGVIYARVGDNDSAIKEINEAIRLEPRFKDQGEKIIAEIAAGALRQK